MSGSDEFEWIARLRPLTRGDPAALNLMDDAAVMPARPGWDLVISKDALVEGVHFPVGAPGGDVARRLLRVNLSDLAAKAADPYGYFLMTAWPAARDAADREAFRQALAEEGERFAFNLLGGDTVATAGPLVVSATVLGWAPAGAAVLRSGARPGDRLVVCGHIGDGYLGWKAARGEIDDPTGELAGLFRAPEPLLSLTDALRTHAVAAADVSDGLLADAGHIAEASGCGLELDLAASPLSATAQTWLAIQPDRAAALLALATGGDDYALVCATRHPEALIRAAEAAGVPAAAVGAFRETPGLDVTVAGRAVTPSALGWRHG